jgi:hypothetical protein
MRHSAWARQYAQWIEPFLESFGARNPTIPEEDFKIPIPRLSGKEGAKDIPSWARGLRPRVGESGKLAAKRVMDDKYGPGNWERDPNRTSEFQNLRKYFDRSFRDPQFDIPT